eukprot:TRINITY_DN57944_c0_g1_i1.p1 TRINITY_DN57944_c0_g1~~TRINITY_DN57944_c0_g1_i1.p1  ORF type:complete len:298 (-),score=38.93 TRINITY_DN57944_c0_g1_i1:61-954(-)
MTVPSPSIFELLQRSEPPISAERLRSVRGIKLLFARDYRSLQPHYLEPIPSWPGGVLLRHHVEKSLQIVPPLLLLMGTHMRSVFGTTKSEIASDFYKPKAQRNEDRVIPRARRAAIVRLFGPVFAGSLFYFFAKVERFQLDADRAASAAFVKANHAVENSINSTIRWFWLGSVVLWPFFMRRQQEQVDLLLRHRFLVTFAYFTLAGWCCYLGQRVFGFGPINIWNPDVLPYMPNAGTPPSYTEEGWKKLAEINRVWRSHRPSHVVMQEIIDREKKEAAEREAAEREVGASTGPASRS